MKPLKRREGSDEMDEALKERIDTWLAGRRTSSKGGWAAVTDEDVRELGGIVQHLIEAKCEVDADGDTPIDVHLINRRKFWPSHRSLVPYQGSDREVLRPLMTNARSAIHALDIELEIRQSRRSGERRVGWLMFLVTAGYHLEG